MAAEFQNFCEELGIKINYASVAHPQSNGQVEKANGLVCEGIKKRLLAPLKQAASKWIEELPAVLWSLRTTPNSSTQYTPFFLVYGAEAVLPHDLKFGAPRISVYEEEEAEEALQNDKDIADEARDTAIARSEGYQDKLRTYQSSRLRIITFNKGDLVLRLIQEKVHKLAPQWEGPFIISEVIGGGAYRLKNPKTNEDVGNPWNVANLACSTHSPLNIIKTSTAAPIGNSCTNSKE